MQEGFAGQGDGAMAALLAHLTNCAGVSGLILCKFWLSWLINLTFCVHCSLDRRVILPLVLKIRSRIECCSKAIKSKFYADLFFSTPHCDAQQASSTITNILRLSMIPSDGKKSFEIFSLKPPSALEKAENIQSWPSLCFIGPIYCRILLFWRQLLAFFFGCFLFFLLRWKSIFGMF